MKTIQSRSPDFFLGATTPAGFKGYFEPLRREPGMQMLLIKSGPGCGKSTLMKVLTGIYTRDAGSLLWLGKETTFNGPKSSQEAGIGIIHQELNLIPQLTIAENIFLGNEVAKGGVINWAEATRRTSELLAKVGLKENPSTLITHIGVGKQQLIEIAKALSKDVRLLILDEPTRGIDIGAKYEIYKLINQLVQQGIAVIVISSELPEVLGLSDRVLVMHEGKLKANLVNHHLTQEQVMEAALRSEHHVEKHVV